MFGELYTQGSDRVEDTTLVEMLRDDKYRGRRRLVPGSHAGGTDLYLFDMVLDLSQAGQMPAAGALIACLATPGDDGMIVQIPWRVFQPAFA
jgi:hypothetical protein